MKKSNLKIVKEKKHMGDEVAIELTEHQIKFLASRGYTDNQVAFVAGLTEQERAGFFAEAEAWKEGSREEPEQDQSHVVATVTPSGMRISGPQPK